MSVSEAEAREPGRIDFAVYRAGCPAVDLLGLIGNRWVSLAVYALGRQKEPLRYGDLKRALPGITKKMLTETLRALEHHGVVTRTVGGTAPARVDYELTPLGLSLHDLLLTIRAWAESHLPQPAATSGRAD